MTQQTLLSIAHALYEGNPQPVRANNEKLTEIVLELRQLLKEQGDDGLAETPVHGYVLALNRTGAPAGAASHLILPRVAQINIRMHRATTWVVSIQQRLGVMINAKEKHCHQRLLAVMLAL